MDFTPYRTIFQRAADQLDQKQLRARHLETAVVEILDSVALKLYKKSWANPSPDVLSEATRIFFSVWLTESSIKNQRLHYNIHALKLRHLQGYHIQSRKFAAAFRARFKAVQHHWPNVEVNCGPLTLMEGFPLNKTGSNWSCLCSPGFLCRQTTWLTLP